MSKTLADMSVEELQAEAAKLHKAKAKALADHKKAMQPIRAAMDRKLREQEMARKLGDMSDGDKAIVADLLKAGDS